MDDKKNEYIRLKNFIISYPEISSNCLNCLETNEQEKYCQIISQIYEPDELSKWIDFALDHEFKSRLGDEGSTLRGNSIITKVITLYCRQMQGDFIKNMLHDVVSILINSENLLEVDTNKVSEQQSKTNRICIETILSKLIEKITNKKNMESFPESIKAICIKIADLAKKYHPGTDEHLTLVGGLVMLRLYNPSLTSPVVFKIIPDTTVVSPTSQKNLILSSRIIQHLSNNLLFLKPPYDVFDPWLQKKETQIKFYFQSLIDLPEENAKCLKLEKVSTPCEYSETEIGNLFHKVLWKFQDVRKKNPQAYENENKNSEAFLKLVDLINEMGSPKNDTVNILQKEKAANHLRNFFESKQEEDKQIFNKKLEEIIVFIGDKISDPNTWKNESSLYSLVEIASLLSDEKFGVKTKEKTINKKKKPVFPVSKGIDWLLSNFSGDKLGATTEKKRENGLSIVNGIFSISLISCKKSDTKKLKDGKDKVFFNLIILENWRKVIDFKKKGDNSVRKRTGSFVREKALEKSNNFQLRISESFPMEYLKNKGVFDSSNRKKEKKEVIQQLLTAMDDENFGVPKIRLEGEKVVFGFYETLMKNWWERYLFFDDKLFRELFDFLKEERILKDLLLGGFTYYYFDKDKLEKPTNNFLRTNKHDIKKIEREELTNSGSRYTTIDFSNKEESSKKENRRSVRIVDNPLIESKNENRKSGEFKGEVQVNLLRDIELMPKKRSSKKFITYNPGKRKSGSPKIPISFLKDQLFQQDNNEKNASPEVTEKVNDENKDTNNNNEENNEKNSNNEEKIKSETNGTVVPTTSTPTPTQTENPITTTTTNTEKVPPLFEKKHSKEMKKPNSPSLNRSVSSIELDSRYLNSNGNLSISHIERKQKGSVMGLFNNSEQNNANDVQRIKIFGDMKDIHNDIFSLHSTGSRSSAKTVKKKEKKGFFGFIKKKPEKEKKKDVEKNTKI